jgi:hypothetical protein
MAVTQTYTSSSQMSGDALAEHILDGSYGYAISNAVLQLIDSEHTLALDGQSIVSDGTLVINTSASKKLIFGVDDTERLQITTDGALDILSAKLLINGNTGASGQVLTTDGFGNISWTSVDAQVSGFGSISVSGQTTVSADQAGDSLTFVAGTGIDITTDASTDTITITNTGTGSGTVTNAFKTISVDGTSIVADQSTDTLTLTSGDNISFTVDTANDSIEISASTDGELNQNAFTSVASTDQVTLTADEESDTLNIESEEDTTSDARYADDRDTVTIRTDSSLQQVMLTNNVPKTLSMASKVPIVTQTGINSGIPLRNKFFNVATSDPVSGGGGYIGVSTRSIPVLQSDGSTTVDVLMPAKSDNSTLQLTLVNSSGTDQIMDMEVAE